jgi:hypothetical protein
VSARQKGIEAFEAQLTIWVCPFEDGTREQEDFDNGWFEAQSLFLKDLNYKPFAQYEVSYMKEHKHG